MATPPKVHMIELRRRNRKQKTIDTGASLEVLLDGKKLHGVRSIQINAAAGKIATVRLEMVGAIKSKIFGSLDNKLIDVLEIQEEE